MLLSGRLSNPELRGAMREIIQIDVPIALPLSSERPRRAMPFLAGPQCSFMVVYDISRPRCGPRVARFQVPPGPEVNVALCLWRPRLGVLDD